MSVNDKSPYDDGQPKTFVFCGNALMLIHGEIAHHDYTVKELYKKGLIPQKMYDLEQRIIHYYREAKAGIDPPRPYRKQNEKLS